ncbi:uncharacterized protein LOC112637982 [Camponotus floridanus]|uniref:uncharacterized protein LOC112637982 n=1 Tax=Camponotus floridanus TaxID=104421 RepID=UPI000DC69979|nr:uncharacterized protein LOC112637982 [Camponotus floridanus]
MSVLLADENTYKVLNKSPIKKLTNNLHDLLVRWRSRDYISVAKYRSLNCTDGVLPRAYGLPKIHKKNNPLRVIVSSKNTPLYGLAKFLHDIIYKSVPRPDSQVINSAQVVDRLNGRRIDDNIKLISLDVISLFTNIPLDLAIDSLSNRWDYIGGNCQIPRDEFLTAVRFVLNSTFFMFNGVCYQQTFGTPMGSPLSPIIAEITLQDLESKAIATLPVDLPFYFRYVDDVVLAAPSSMLNTILNTFNSFHTRMQFTMEEGVDNRLNFLDVTIILEHGLIYFNWFHKPTFSGKYLHFESRHPLCQKRGTIIGLTDKVFRLSHPRFHKENFEFIIDILLNNGFNNRLDNTLTADNNEVDGVDGGGRISYFNVPYVKNFSDRFRQCVRDLEVKLFYTGINNLRRFIKVGKDRLDKDSRNNIVYKINCMDCNASYVGQTGRLLKTRLKEHKKNLTSVIAEHRALDHTLDFDGVEILDEEAFLGRRLISEMIHIKRQRNALNLQNDTLKLNASCLSIIDNISKI